ncbi:MAG: sugar nucleotide-binding protein [Planctomycetes bacterium]|nr:sugar nucleotide-binding protein [Planctomycetota bacterium]
MRVVVLGGSGMLGSALLAVLCREPGLELHASARTESLARAMAARVPGVRWFLLDAAAPALDRLPAGADWVINAVGVIKHLMRADDPASIEQAILANALLPHRLAAWATAAGARVLQIATDCVYSGVSGGYAEDAPHDALDAYGKTKSLGEVRGPGLLHLRCSIVGPEARGRRSLLEWLLERPPGATVPGFTNHRWNGVTTLHFARLVRGLLRGGDGAPESGLQHVVPADTITKADLLAAFARRLGRSDLTIVPGPAEAAVDRTLATRAPERNLALWRAAGYDRPPSILAMLDELAAWDYPFRGLEAPP